MSVPLSTYGLLRLGTSLRHAIGKIADRTSPSSNHVTLAESSSNLVTLKLGLPLFSSTTLPISIAIFVLSDPRGRCLLLCQAYFLLCLIWDGRGWEFARCPIPAGHILVNAWRRIDGVSVLVVDDLGRVGTFTLRFVADKRPVKILATITAARTAHVDYPFSFVSSDEGTDAENLFWS